MADVITRFKLETTQYDSKLRDASKGLAEYTRLASVAGNEFGKFTQKNVEAARALGTMTPSANNAKDKVKELVSAFNDTAKAYNALTREQQQSDFGKAMSASLEQLIAKIKEAKTELYDLDKTAKNAGSSSGGGMFSGIGSKMEGALAVFGGNLMTKAAGAVAQLGSEMADMVKQGIEMAKAGEGVRIAFERLGRGDILQGLREATHGTVTDLELMKAAVKFNDFKLPLDELGTMLAFAQQKAKDTGQSVDYMVDSIVTGLGRKSLMILDNLGLSANEIKEKMAETGDMTKAVGAIIREQMSKAGDYVETAADRAAQADVELKNAMEELGRTFQPIAAAGASMWQSLEVGALKLLKNAVEPLIARFTELGRLKAQTQLMGGDEKVNRMTTRLQNAQPGNRQSLYSQQVEQFNRYINERQNYINDLNAYRGGSMNDRRKQRIDEGFAKFGTSDTDRLQLQIDAARRQLSDYQAAAKEILAPVKTEIDTKEAGQNVDTLKKKLKELEDQRKAAIKAGDQDLTKNLTKQINQTKTEIRGLDPNALKTTGTDPVKQAADKVAAAQHEYAQSIEAAKMSLDNGTKTEADYKKQLLSAEERLWDALGDAYNVHKDPKYKEAQDECAKKIKELGGEVTASVEAQKKAQEAARQLEAAEKKLADAQTKLADAQASGDLKQIYAAEKGVQTAESGVRYAQQNVDALSQSATVEVIPQWAQAALNALPKELKDSLTGKTDIPLTTGNLSAFIAKMKDDIANANLGESITQSLESLNDATAISTILQTAIQNGIDTAEFDTSGLMKKLMNGEDIGDDVIQGYVDQLNAMLKEKFDETEWPKVLIKFDVNTGKITNATSEIEKDAKKTQQAWNLAAQSVGNLAAAFNSIEDPGAKALGTVIKAIADIALGFASASVQASSLGPIGWIAWLAAGTAALATTISTVHSLTGLANGGIVDGRSGGFVGGTAYSGDNIGNVRLDAGELVLNRAQQTNLANTLEGSPMNNLQLETHLGAEEIIFILNNNADRRGYGNFIQD